jgi:hypothetical protein
MTTVLASLTPEIRNDECIHHALRVRSAWALNHYHSFFRLYTNAPKMSGYLMDWFAERCRKSALKSMIKSYVLLLATFPLSLSSFIYLIISLSFTGLHFLSVRVHFSLFYLFWGEFGSYGKVKKCGVHFQELLKCLEGSQVLTKCLTKLLFQLLTVLLLQVVLFDCCIC